MLIAQALVERGLLDSLVSSIWSAMMQVEYYVGQGNTKWLLIGLAVVMGYLFLRPKR